VSVCQCVWVCAPAESVRRCVKTTALPAVRLVLTASLGSLPSRSGCGRQQQCCKSVLHFPLGVAVQQKMLCFASVFRGIAGRKGMLVACAVPQLCKMALMSYSMQHVCIFAAGHPLLWWGSQDREGG